jgi:hypothetical protein
VVYAVYTNGSTDAPISTAASYISPYFNGSYWTGVRPPIYGTIYTPFTAVIDLETMIVIDRDVDSTNYMSTTDIMNAVNGANAK